MQGAANHSRIIAGNTAGQPQKWRLAGCHAPCRLAPPALLIADSNGINYLIHDRYALDKTSRKILDRFL